MSLVENLRTAYQAWNDTRGESVDVWLSLMADSIKMQSLADGAVGLEFSATRHGRDEVKQYFVELNNQWNVLSFVADEFIVQEDRIVVLGHGQWRSTATGKDVYSPIAHFWRFVDGKATEFFEFYDTAKAAAAASLN